MPDIKDLNLAEAALLAGLPQAPTAYSPFGLRPENAKDRQISVLLRMREDGYITKEQEENAVAEELMFSHPNILEYYSFSIYYPRPF